MVKKTIEVDEILYNKAEKIVKENGYSTVNDFVNSVLKELVEENEGPALSEKDKEKVKERLKSLGYMD